MAVLRAEWKKIGHICICLSLTSVAHAETCFSPPRPFVPSDPKAARDYGDLIQSDFETYISEIQDYFRCLDEERARAFEEAREVSQEYGSFLAERRD